MDIEQLQCFTTIARIGRMKGAAKALNLSPQELSNSLAALEKELHANLFIGSEYNLRLSDFGQVFYQYAKQGLPEIPVEQLIMECTSKITHPVLSVNIFCPEIFSMLIPAFLKEHPEVELRQKHRQGKNLTESLLKGETDIAITDGESSYFGIYSREGIKWIPILDEELLLLVPKNSALANSSKLEYSQLKNERLVDIPRSETRWNTGYLPIMVGGYGSDRIIVPDYRCVKELVSLGYGIALIPASEGMTIQDHDNLVLRRIDGHSYDRTIRMRIPEKRYMTNAAKNFYDFTLSYIKEHEQVLQVPKAPACCDQQQLSEISGSTCRHQRMKHHIEICESAD